MKYSNKLLAVDAVAVVEKMAGILLLLLRIFFFFSEMESWNPLK